MPTFARINGGTVAELYTPTKHAGVPIGQLFHKDLDFMDVTALNPQPGIGWTYDGHTFAPPPPPPPPTPAQQGAALLAGVVTVECASLPALNGGYAISPAAQGQVTAIAAAINAGLGLPGDGPTFNWPDATGTQHPWPAPQFTAFAKGVMNFLYAAGQVAQGNGTVVPSATIAIA